MLILIIIIPITAALGVLMLREKNAHRVAVTGSLLSLLLAGYIVWQVVAGKGITNEFAGLPGIPFILHAGQFSAIVLLIVTFVAFFIFLYSIGYMSLEKGKKTFWAGMSLFLAAMQLLVLSNDWVSFIMGWELTGFASYRLIATWHHQQDAREGSAKAFMITRITDMGLYLGVFLIFLQTGSSVIDIPIENLTSLAGFAILFAVMGKSAQVPFQSWLSGAMAGPTPVSSLLHSATLVAAGIILLLKSYHLLPAEVLPWIAATGGITIVAAGLTAVFSDDLKQMLAASTSSHLGFMVLAVGAGYPGAAAAHLLAHAFMKSSLFLGAGIWQHDYESTSFNKIRAAGKHYKFIYLLFALSAAALAGIPPLIGYFSKDAVLAAGLKSNSAFWYFSAATAGALLSALYAGRALSLLWNGNSKSNEAIPVWWMRTGMIFPAVLIIAGGFFLKPVLKFMHLVMPHSTAAIAIGIAAAVIGLATGWLFLSKQYKNAVANFIRNNYTIAGGYRRWVVEPALQLAQMTVSVDKVLDKMVDGTGTMFYQLSRAVFIFEKIIGYLVQGIGQLGIWLGHITDKSDDAGIDEAVRGIANFFKKLGVKGQKLQNGMVHRELLWSVAGFIGFILILIVLNL